MVTIRPLMVLSRFVSSNGVSIRLKTKARASGHTSRHFVDMKKVVVQGGKGGDGCIAFQRHFCNPYGGPSGGDGGNGGHVIFKADPEMIDFSAVNSVIKAPDGSRGSGSNQHGVSGKHLVVKVPVGTQVHEITSKEDFTVSAHRSDASSLLRILAEPSETLIGARGGAGGRGNAFFSSANQNGGEDTLPRIRQSSLRLAERGAMGQSRRLLLRLTTFADVGLVGAPNAGKSTLLRRLTRARPRVAPHPFTTLKPNVGILEIPLESDDTDTVDNIKLSIADLPGLIEGAAERNAGLGAQFLSLIEGCCLLLYLVDVGTFFVNASKTISSSEITAYFTSQLGMLHRELELFNPNLVDSAARNSLVIGTKIDLVVLPSEGQETLLKISACLYEAAKESNLQSPEVLLISARRGDNVEQLMKLLRNMYCRGKEV